MKTLDELKRMPSHRLYEEIISLQAQLDKTGKSQDFLQDQLDGAKRNVIRMSDELESAKKINFFALTALAMCVVTFFVTVMVGCAEAVEYVPPSIIADAKVDAPDKNDKEPVYKEEKLHGLDCERIGVFEGSNKIGYLWTCEYKGKECLLFDKGITCL